MPRRVRLRSLSLGLAVCLVILFAVTASAAPQSTLRPFQIRKLTGSIVKLGTINSGGNRYALYGARLQVTICFHSASEANNNYPNEIRTTHYSVSKSRKRWWAARIVSDRAPWLVPFGETWHGKRCGKVEVEDPIPPDHYGVESLGRACYGVGVRITVGSRRASKLAVLTCHPKFG